MKGNLEKTWYFAAILTLLFVNVWHVLAQSHSVPSSPAAAQSATVADSTRDKILTYIRERFGVPDTVKLSLGPSRTSLIAPGFNEALVTVDDGKTQKQQPILVSKDSRYLIVVMGGIVDLPQNSEAEMVKQLQEVFKTPANIKLSVGGFRPSIAPDFQQGNLTIDDGHSKSTRTLLIARDGKHLIMSEIYPLAVDPREKALKAISLRDEATQGSSNAPVTIVEYADLECPVCARMNEFLETQVVPRYGNKVRIVFKEYPLPMHDWSMTAAIGCQCAYQINPSAFVALRTAIFRNQQTINITNVRDMVLNFGEQAGINRVQLAGCLDAKSSMPRIQRDMEEAKRVDVNQTPTLFINGRMLVGLPSEEAYFEAIDLALRNAK